MSLLKKDNDEYKNLIIKGKKFIENYNKNNTYKMGILYSPENGNIIITINDKLIYSTMDTTLKGNFVGLFSKEKIQFLKISFLKNFNQFI